MRESLELKAIEVASVPRVGQGGFLLLRRLRLRLLRSDGTRTQEGLWDYVERPMGLDAVVVAIFRNRAAPEVLLRHGVRVPLQFGRPKPPDRLLLPELVAGILERGEESEAAVRQRAAGEALEEAGLRIEARSVERLGPPMFPSPGMCAEQFHFVCAEAPGDTPVATPSGDGSPFEEGARLEWVPLDEALRRCATGDIQDLKTELGLRRLQEKLAAP
jgi:ADP-ribose pyrophosphatase